MNEYFVTFWDETTGEIPYFTVVATPSISEVYGEDDIFKEGLKDYSVSRSGIIVREYDIR